jgi:predicted dehydrogenase
MTSSSVRIGLVGYGSGGRFFHAPLLATAEGCDFVGVVTTSPDRRALVSRDHPEVAVFADLEALVDAGADAVAISTPASTHSALCDRALRLGLHVVCDKPFALDANAALATVELADQLGLQLSAYQNRRWDSDFLTVRSIVDAGRLGTVTQFESWFERFAPTNGPKVAGGGTLLDFCSHLADQALVLLGPVDAVYANSRPRDAALDDDVFVSLHHANGARSRLWGSWSQGAPGHRFRVTGENGAYVVDGPMDGQEPALLAGETPRSLGDRWGHEPPERWGRIRRGADEEIVPTIPGAWHTYYPAFAAAVRGAADVPVPARDAVDTARVLDAARRSAASRTVIELSPLLPPSSV